MSDQQWNAWLQGHLAIERSQNLADVVRKINGLLAPRDQTIAELRKQIAELRGSRRVHQRDAPKLRPWTQEECDRYVMSLPKASDIK
jgi:hypothetical protein